MEKWFIVHIPSEQITIAGKAYVSTDAITLLTNDDINVILSDSFGNLVPSCSE